MPESPIPHVASGPRDDATGTRYTCPDCGGVLFEQDEGGIIRFRCSVGHVLSIESLSTAQAGQLENALWTAVRALEDRADLLRRMASRAETRGHARSASSFRDQLLELESRATVIREAIQHAHGEASAEAAS